MPGRASPRPAVWFNRTRRASLALTFSFIPSAVTAYLVLNFAQRPPDRRGCPGAYTAPAAYCRRMPRPPISGKFPWPPAVCPALGTPEAG